jgi:membrane protein
MTRNAGAVLPHLFLAKQYLPGLTMKLREFWELSQLTTREWSNDNAFRLSASLAFYTIFSIAPIIVIVIAVAGFIFGDQAATNQLVHEVQVLAGPQGARAVREIINNAASAGGGPLAASLGIITLIVGSTGVLAELQSALNQIWDVQIDPARGKVTELVRSRLFALGVVVGIGFLLLLSLLLSAGLSGAAHLLGDRMSVAWLWQTLNSLASLLLATGLFMMVYKLLPDVKTTWRDVAVGGFVTAVLFTLGKFLIGEYLGRVSIGSTYGAASSFAVLLIWVYYSALVSFYGAEFTQVYARRFGSGIRPRDYAIRRGAKSDRI